MNVQRRGPLFKHQAQGTAWSREPLPRRGTIRLTLLIVGIWLAGTLAVVAITDTSQAGSAGIGSPDAQPASVVEPGAGVGAAG